MVGTGGVMTPTGGTVATGGATITGGTTTTGGLPITGGKLATGGNVSSGGTVSTGGDTVTGGTANGGVMATGGAKDAGLDLAMATGGITVDAARADLPAAKGGTTTVTCASGSACIDFSTLQQEIDGFGAAQPGNTLMTTAQLDAAFKNDTNKQMGLSILRTEIDTGGQSSWNNEKSNATNAKARGVKYVFGTPWSPPASMKTNGNVVGGELKTTSYAEYAAYLKSYADYVGAVDIISVQNEPNITVTYASATWNATQLLNFVKNNAQDIGTAVMMPESSNYDTALSDPTLNDATAASHIGYIGLHLYGASMRPYTLAVQKQKKVWMTEYFFNGEDVGSLMSMAKNIMDCIDNQMNAYVWWYLTSPSCNLIDSSGNLNNKGNMMGQFAKWIRPGAHRVSAPFSPQSNVNVQAFAGQNYVVLALNRNTSAKSQSFTLNGANLASLQKYTTSASKKLSDDGPVAITNGTFTVSLDAQSMTTFVATAP